MPLSGEPAISPTVFGAVSITSFCRGDREEPPGVDLASGVGKASILTWVLGRISKPTG